MKTKYYQFLASNENGNQLKGKIRALNEHSVEEIILRRAQKCLHIQETNALGAGISDQQQLYFLIQLASFLDAGLPLLSALEDNANHHQRRQVRDCAAGIAQLIRDGYGCSAALAEFPEIFDDLSIRLIAVAEQTGELGKAFNQAANVMRTQMQTRTKLRQLMIYPIFVGLLLIILIRIVVGDLLPEFSKIYIDFGLDLPTPTKILLSSAAFLKTHLSSILVFLMIILLFLISAAKLSPRCQLTMHYSLLQTPLLGRLLSTIELSRCLSVMHTLYKGGIALIECLTTVEKLPNNHYIRHQFCQIRHSIAAGQTLRHSFLLSGLLPSFIIQLLSAGEQSGALEVSLQKSVEYMLEQQQDISDKLQKTLEPTCIIILGACVLWLALAIFAPVFSIISSVGKI